MEPFLDISDLSFAYETDDVLHGVSLNAPAGASVALLGPNGSGKTTLFRLLSGLSAVQSGQVKVLGHLLPGGAASVRRELGIVFQSPSLDDKLSVRENLHHHGHLYGLYGQALQQRIDELLQRLELTDRATWRVGKLSGGLKRQVELARCLLHTPKALLLDEPSTGLDPTARRRFWTLLNSLASETGMSTLFTTHWFEEAELAGTVGILNNGELVAWGAPEELKASLGSEVIQLSTKDPTELAAQIKTTYDVEGQILGDSVRLVLSPEEHLAPKLMSSMPEGVTSITVGKPTLEDVFIARTGRALEAAE